MVIMAEAVTVTCVRSSVSPWWDIRTRFDITHDRIETRAEFLDAALGSCAIAVGTCAGPCGCSAYWNATHGRFRTELA